MSDGFMRLFPGTACSRELGFGNGCRQGFDMKSASAFIALPFALCAAVFAQTVPPSPGAVDKFPSAITETECQGEQCADNNETHSTWVFHGYLGNAQWSNGATAEIVLERFDDGGVVMHRIDLPMSTSFGLTAVYTGTLKGNRIEGTVVWSWSGHWNDTHPSGKWSATVKEILQMQPPARPLPIPATLTECEANQCSLGREGGCEWEFHGMDGEGHCRNGADEKLVIKQFDADGIVIFRTEKPNSISNGLTAIYTGTLHDNRITGLGTWSWPGHWNGHRPSGKWSARVREPASTELPPVPDRLISPEVHPDGTVTFRYLDPYSMEVFLELEGAKPTIMQRDDFGVWSTTTAPLEPDYYGYLFRNADIAVIDPHNPLILPNLQQTENMVHIPGPATLPWEVGDGAHGAISHRTYKSEVTGDEQEFYVYTPPGYDPHEEKEYPVLYLLHGFGQEARSWTEVAFANRILDHLINEGKAKPMVVVMPNGYGGPELMANGPKFYWNDSMRDASFNKFTGALLTEVIPQVEHDYRVKKDRDSRAIAGLSMGGAESLLTGLNHLDKFSWVGAFSSGGIRKDIDEDFPGLDASANSKLHLLWVACGTDDGLIGVNRDFRKWLAAKGIAHTDIETPGQHTWMVWRRNLASFAPLLFR
jgi:enterochelin esterase family protein